MEPLYRWSLYAAGAYIQVELIIQGTHGTGKTGKTGKMGNTNSLQGKRRELENLAKLREFQSDIFLNLLIIILLNYDM